MTHRTQPKYRRCHILSLYAILVALGGCTATTSLFPMPGNAPSAKILTTSFVSVEDFPDGRLNKDDIEKVLIGSTLLGVGGNTGDSRVRYRYHLAFQRGGVVLSGDKEIVGKWWVAKDIFYISVPGWKNSVSEAAVFVSDGKLEFRDPNSNDLWLSQY